MLNRTIALIATLIAFAAASVAAQSSVSIASFPYDVEAAGQGIREQVSDGMMPVGIEIVEDEGIWVLFVDSGSETGPNFSIHQFSAPENLEAEMTQIIQRGWAPVGLSRTSSRLYGLFVQEEHNIAGWRIHRSPSDESSIQDSLQQFHTDGFSTAGVSILEDGAWYLFVRGENQPQERVTFHGIEENEEAIQAQLTQLVQGGWTPAGISQLSNGLVLLYTQPILDE